MLKADYLDTLPDSILDIYERYNQSVINDIARRLSNLNFASAAWQVQRLNESSMLYKSILEKLAILTGKSEKELRAIFKKAGVKAMRFDDSIYKVAGLEPLPLNMSPAMTAVLKAGLERTNNLLNNIVRTTALEGQNLFIEAADLAYMQVATGAMDYNSAIKAAVKSISARGLTVISYTGRKDQLDVAVRRAVLTGVNLTAGNLTEARADEMGVDLVQTSAHIGARPTHQVWQGKVFSRSGKSDKYPDFVTSTGYGTGEGLCGWNCRHSFYPFFEGISENVYKQTELEDYANKKVTYRGEEISFYDATQKQREIERTIRRYKREAGALEAAGKDNTLETGKVKEWQARMRMFVKETGIYRQREREQI
jgi:hypothetical protein